MDTLPPQQQPPSSPTSPHSDEWETLDEAQTYAGTQADPADTPQGPSVSASPYPAGIAPFSASEIHDFLQEHVTGSVHRFVLEMSEGEQVLFKHSFSRLMESPIRISLLDVLESSNLSDMLAKRGIGHGMAKDQGKKLLERLPDPIKLPVIIGALGYGTYSATRGVLDARMAVIGTEPNSGSPDPEESPTSEQ